MSLTPVADFVKAYDGTIRLHMPGHKGKSFLGCESLDITEVQGADALYEAEGIIARSEEIATALFGSGKTVYSAEGSSQCIRAMIYLAIMNRKPGTEPMILAARNVHKAFVYGVALTGAQVCWLWPEGESKSICGCNVTAEGLEKALKNLRIPPAAVYITSPDYLGHMADIRGLAQVCHNYGTRLLVDNAHGAYLHFLDEPMHPLDLGADLCCDSAHKTLPVLTGGAYLHARKELLWENQMKSAMALFGSTSPSYLIMQSLDLCNCYLSEGYRERLKICCQNLMQIRKTIREHGWTVLDTDPLRLTIAAPQGMTGVSLAEKLRRKRIECEFADPEQVVFMVTPENTPEDLKNLVEALGSNSSAPRTSDWALPVPQGEQVMSIREAFFTAHETVAAEKSLGRICGAPTVGCPPAIPIAVSGERIGAEALELFSHYGIETVDVLK